MWGRCPLSDSIDLKFITFMKRYGNWKEKLKFSNIERAEKISV